MNLLRTKPLHVSNQDVKYVSISFQHGLILLKLTSQNEKGESIWALNSPPSQQHLSLL